MVEYVDAIGASPDFPLTAEKMGRMQKVGVVAVVQLARPRRLQTHVFLQRRVLCVRAAASTY